LTNRIFHYKNIIAFILIFGIGIVSGFLLNQFLYNKSITPGHKSVVQMTLSEDIPEETKRQQPRHTIPPTDTSNQLLQTDTLFNDTLNILPATDTSHTYTDTSITDINASVRRDRMVAKKTIILIEETSTDTPADSALASLTKSSSQLAGTNNTYILEFWESPVNYKGYKVLKKKIILFGLSPSGHYALTKEDDKMLLKTKSATYLLRIHDDFLPFKKQP
jgi:hypothetical protein